jgi:small subunit ribosomal protein S3
MGQKINPVGLRLGINRTWNSRWYADSDDYGRLLHEDLKIEKYLKDRLKQAGVSRIIIERPHKRCIVTIHTARPGLVIGKKGADIETLRKDLAKVASDSDVRVNLVEIRKPEVDANLVAEDIARQLERRGSFRRAMKRAIQSAMRLGALGVKVQVAGRLGGAEIARTEQYAEGSVPLHTLRADIDYGTAEALTTYGIIGVKVWVYKGVILEHDPMAQDKRLETTGQSRARAGEGRGPATGGGRDRERGGERDRGGDRDRRERAGG